ncbi:MAG: GtrA family protein, partial [Anaerolineae bacterium]|nr:GtrA family protein [Anaerolineae bacterium]
AEEKLGTIIAQMIAMVVVMLWNFFANRYWTYRDVK